MKWSDPIKQNPNTPIILCSLLSSLSFLDSGWKYVQFFFLQTYFDQQESCQNCSSSFLLLGFQSGIQTQLSFCQCRERFPNSEQEFLCRKQGAALSQGYIFKSCLGSLNNVDSMSSPLWSASWQHSVVCRIILFPFFPLQRGMRDLESIK